MDVFVYGTLTDPGQAGAVLDRFEYVDAATLVGAHRVDGQYPTLAPGGRVDGRLLRTDELAALDRYEGVDRGLYVRVSVPLVAGEGDASDELDCEEDASDEPDREAAVYVGDPEALDAPAEWPGDGPFADRVRRGLAAHDPRVIFK
jgi:gamma-glutamylcyclotransferase (GGCT)/AIG2-like uncharacterized protein YtfP